MNQSNTELIDRFVKGLTNEEENAEVERLFREGEDNEALRQKLLKDWESDYKPGILLDKNLRIVLDKIHYKIFKTEYLKQRKPLQHFIRIYSRAAAILLLPLIIAASLVFRFSSNRPDSGEDARTAAEIYAPLGSRVSFNLPDGTVGMLNSGSRLTYSLPFTRNRSISLEGESWFDVKSDADNPFVIDIGKATVRVLGTSFNVSAYPDQNYLEVVLKQGKVEFLDKSTEQVITMQPSERIVSQNGNVTKSVTDPEKYIGWTGGKLIFRGDPMSEVARRIERWYNVEVIIADKEIEKYSYRATFEDDNLDDVFRFLSMTSPITYEIKPRQMNPDGTYNKEEITLYMKK